MRFVLQFIICLTIFIPTALFGQAKNCYAFTPSRKVCLLTPSKIDNDTIVTILPQKCNSPLFDSTANGLWKIYAFDSTTLLEIVNIKNGQHNGIDIVYFSDGQIQKQSFYINGQLDGNFVTFHETGKVCFKGEYRKNEFNGTESQYWDNGNIARISRYKNGTSRLFKDVKYWNRNGKRIKPEVFLELWYECD